ncbi:MAG: DUF1572 family protein [Bacteroidia bacterium]
MSLSSFTFEFERMKLLAEKAFSQVSDEHFFKYLPGEGNSMATVVKHVSGNQRSRFTDFLTTDGEKPWRKRDEEFEHENDTREALMAGWHEGWKILLDTLASLSEANLHDTVFIRKEPLTVESALFRQVAHYSYHIGQLVMLAKMWAGVDWQSLSIPKGKSSEHNQGSYLNK